MAPELHLMG